MRLIADAPASIGQTESETTFEGICERTETVRTAILDALPDVSDCAAASLYDLRTMEDLHLLDAGITSLKAGDLDDLLSVTSLDLNGNSLSALPEGIFDDLISLTYLTLYGNSITELPDGVFDSLTKLYILNIGDNPLTELPDGVFDSLTRLTSLSIRGNSLSTRLGPGVEPCWWQRRDCRNSIGPRKRLLHGRPGCLH